MSNEEDRTKATEFTITGTARHVHKDNIDAGVAITLNVESVGLCVHEAAGVLLAVAASLRENIVQVTVGTEHYQAARAAYLAAVLTMATEGLGRFCEEEEMERIAALFAIKAKAYREHLRSLGQLPSAGAVTVGEWVEKPEGPLH